jgi:hypothetical protein
MNPDPDPASQNECGSGSTTMPFSILQFLSRLHSRFFSFHFRLTFALVFVILWTAALALTVRSRHRPVASIVRVPAHEKYTLNLVLVTKKTKGDGAMERQVKPWEKLASGLILQQLGCQHLHQLP